MVRPANLALTNVAGGVRHGPHCRLTTGLNPTQGRHSKRGESMASLHARLAAISSDLLPVSAPRKIPHPYCCPAEFGHDFRQTPEGARSAIALGYFKQVQQKKKPR